MNTFSEFRITYTFSQNLRHLQEKQNVRYDLDHFTFKCRVLTEKYIKIIFMAMA